MRVSLVRIFQSLEPVLASVKAHEAVCTVKSSESLAWYDPEKSSWKTSQQSFLTDWELFSETWPRSGTMRNGYAYELPMLARITTGIGGGCSPEMWGTPNTMDSLPSRSYEAMKRQATNGGRKNRSRPSNLREQIDPLMCQAYDDARAEANQVSNAQMWPTPQARDFRTGDNPDGLRAQRKLEQGWSQNLNDVVRMWPTPAAQDSKNSTLPPSQMERDTVPGALMRSGETGKLNPNWVAWMMNFPLDWFKDGGTSNPTSAELPANQKTGQAN
ncbi:MAG: hypothetical protein A2Z03_02245 [Chloroflexi bacterium RBG_16_56_8]|nr:MAG: hypothetical protein A2Z03_02245 [Chloroflexi bacterium RBG_16_56_8]